MINATRHYWEHYAPTLPPALRRRNRGNEWGTRASMCRRCRIAVGPVNGSRKLASEIVNDVRVKGIGILAVPTLGLILSNNRIRVCEYEPREPSRSLTKHDGR